MVRDLTMAADVRTYGITERQPNKFIEELLRYELGEMTKTEAQQFIETTKGKDRKLAKKLIVDFEEVYG